MPRLAAGCGSSNRKEDTGSATTQSCRRRHGPGRAGARWVLLGAGVGAAGLAVAARVWDLECELVEVDAAVALLGAANAYLYGLSAWVSAVVLDVAAPARAFAAAGLGPESVA